VALHLNQKATQSLDSAIPPNVREFLESADTFQLLLEEEGRDFVAGDHKIKDETKLRTFEPTRIATIRSAKDKRAILEALYADSATDESAASCYEPHHGMRATFHGRTVEIEICYDCAVFYVSGDMGKSTGTISRDHRKSEATLNRLLHDLGVPIK